MNNENEDWREITRCGYEGIGRFYDLFVDNSDIPFFLKYANKIGSPILDLAAGTGRITFALANDGHEVVALDYSPSMLEVANQKLKNCSSEIAKNVTIIEGDIRNFNLDRMFNLIIIPNSFGHVLTTDEQLSTLRCVYNHLTDRGVFILDTYPGIMQHEHVEFKENPVHLSNGTTVERDGNINSDLQRQIMDVNLQYIVRDAQQNIIENIEVVSSTALLSNREVDLLIQLSGFIVEEELGGFDGQAYSSESSRRILILKKGTTSSEKRV